MQRTLANTHQCPGCGSIDVTIKVWGMPLASFGRYMSAYEELSRAITMDAISWEEQEVLNINFSDDDDYFAWYCPEQGRGFYAPGNAYDHGGCVIFESDLDKRGPCRCRSCGMQFPDATFDDEFSDENLSVDQEGVAQDGDLAR